MGDLTAVVGKDEILSAAVAVDRRAKVATRHRRALDVPARPSRAPGTGPSRLVRAGRLPEPEIERALFAWVVGVLSGFLVGRQHVGEFEAAHRAVTGEATRPEEDVAVGRVGHPAVEQNLCCLHDVRDLLADPGIDSRQHDVQIP